MLCRALGNISQGASCEDMCMHVRAGVAWFEVDRPDVLRAKHRVLASAGASFSSQGSAAGALRHNLALSYALWLELPTGMQDYVQNRDDDSPRE